MDAQATTPPTVLTIAGSDSGGAAGLQADLKSLTALGVYGMSVVTVITAQNSVEVHEVLALPASLVAAQMEAVLADYGADAVKTGFIGRVALLEMIATQLSTYREQRSVPIVVDPVLVNHRGEAMFATAVTVAYRRWLLPHADLVTPNCAEAALLVGAPVANVAAMVAAAEQIHRFGAVHVLVTGGREGDDVIDVFYDGASSNLMRARWIATENTHGSGDTLSAAIAAFLARGLPLPVAVARGRAFTAHAIAAASGWHLGAGHGPLNHLA
jgi:hydroxymethylpyrimidine kinase/phosphomethylpyrimidine kinase